METNSTAILTDEFRRRAVSKLEAASAGKFFETNTSKLLPSFECSNEIALGKQLGEGAFCDVEEITSILLKREPGEQGDHGHTIKIGNDNLLLIPQPKQSCDDSKERKEDGEAETDEAGFPVDLFRNEAEIRKYMSENCMRENDAGQVNHARYALKHLKETNNQKQLEQGLIDILVEAKFLSCINHPNIIKMRGIAGMKEEVASFGIVLDRLYMTLEDQMDAWTEEKKAATKSGFCCLSDSMDNATKVSLELSAITVAYDLSCALRYIHKNNLVYRDIKPENAGFDVRGDIKLFDFGFAKELTKNLLDKASGYYKLTKMTGSPPYMAPENFIGKPYGKPVDVFSFGVLVWEMIHCRFAFYQYNRYDYKDLVVQKNYRPPIDNTLSTRMKEFIKESWDPDPKKRPTFDRISLLLRGQYQDLTRQDMEFSQSRSQRMLSISARSYTARNKK